MDDDLRLSCFNKLLRKPGILEGQWKLPRPDPEYTWEREDEMKRKRSLLHFSLSTSGLTISASTHLRNLYISKKIPSQCRYQVHTLDSSNLSLLTSTPTILGLDTSS
ncbi:hypothetical protein Tco_0339523 [Tanacetum coccineum]